MTSLLQWRVLITYGVVTLLVGFFGTSSTQAQSIQLTLIPTTVSFPDANPTTTPSITGSPLLEVRVVVSGITNADTWSVSALADGDLLSGPDTIGIANVSWTTRGPLGGSPCLSCVCHAGTASSTVNQLLFTGAGDTGAGQKGCEKTFYLANSWSYSAGNYSQTITITASIP